ncbi:MAG: hypothetical protein ACXAD7_06230 [Candidatus Kariarchaeaceae archaeon]|jgi:hypothetical protein
MHRKIIVTGIMLILVFGIVPYATFLGTGSNTSINPDAAYIKNIAGFKIPKIDGYIDTFTSSAKIGEWDDALKETVMFQKASPKIGLDQPEEEDEEPVQARVKSVSGNFYLALQLPFQVSQIALQLDINNDGQLSDGDVRLIAGETDIKPTDRFQLISTKIQNRGIKLEVLQKGNWWNPGVFNSADWDPVERNPSMNSFFDYAARISAVGSIGIRGWDPFDKDPVTGISRTSMETVEIRFSPNALANIAEIPNIGISLNELAKSRKIGFSAMVTTATGVAYGYPAAPTATGTDQMSINSFIQHEFDVAIPVELSINPGIGHLEVIQAVQTVNNDLSLIRNKQTLARVFVFNPTVSPLDVEVTLRAYAFNLYTTIELGITSQTFSAPTTVDRMNLDHTANFILPEEWTDVPFLVLEVEVSPLDYVDNDYTNNIVEELFYFKETHDLNIYYVRVNSGTESSPTQVTTAWVDEVTAAISAAYPMANPNFIELGWETLGEWSGSSDQLKAELTDIVSSIVLAILIQLIIGEDDILPIPDQIFGFTTYGGGSSSPSWYEGGLSYAAWGGVGASSGELVMAHEMNHNLGSNEWGRHVSADPYVSTYGCDAAGPDAAWPRDDEYDDQLNALYEDTIGWSSLYGLIPETEDELMSYCHTGSPPKWMSDYRWEALTDRLGSFEAGQPAFPSAAILNGLSSLQLNQIKPDATVRYISGYVNSVPYYKEHKVPEVEMNPSYITSNNTAASKILSDAMKAPIKFGATHFLQVEYSNQEKPVKYPIYANFNDEVNDEIKNQSAFSFWLSDNGTIKSFSVVDLAGNEVPDSARATKGGLFADVTVTEFPTTIVRGKPHTIAWKYDNTTNVYAQLQYTHDGKHWLPIGRPTLNDHVILTFNQIPGGKAKFRLMLSDGFDSVMINFANTVEIPELPTTIQINRNKNWVADDGEHGDGIITTIGSLMSFSASAFNPQRGLADPQGYSWKVESFDKATGLVLHEVISETTGAYLKFQGRDVGTYKITVFFEGVEDSILVEIVNPQYTSREKFVIYTNFLTSLRTSEPTSTTETTETSPTTKDSESDEPAVPVTLSVWLLSLFIVVIPVKYYRKRK